MFNSMHSERQSILILNHFQMYRSCSCHLKLMSECQVVPMPWQDYKYYFLGSHIKLKSCFRIKINRTPGTVSFLFWLLKYSPKDDGRLCPKDLHLTKKLIIFRVRTAQGKAGKGLFGNKSGKSWKTQGIF